MSKLITEDEKLEVIKITAGNDFSLNITVTELQDAETGVWSVLDLNAATDVNLYLVNSNGKRIKLDHTINSTGSLLADVIAGYLQTTTYGVTIEFKLNGRNRRTFSPCLIQLVNSTEEAGTTLAEYVNDVYNLNIRVLSDVALIKMGGSSVIPQDDMVTLAYLEANYYTKDAIDDNYYDIREITNLLSYCITETDLQSALDTFDAEIASEYIDHNELDEALSYYATTDDLTDYATKSYVNEQIAAIPETDLSDYVTYSYLNNKNLASEAYVNEKISEIPQTDLSNYPTYAYINSKGFMTESRLNDLGYLRQSDISAMSYATTNYVDTKIASIDIPDVSNLVSQSSLETQLQPYVTQSQISSASYASTQYVENVTADMATKSYVNEKISGIDTSNLVSYQYLLAQSYLQPAALNEYSTKSYVDSKVAGLASETYVTNAVNAIDLSDFPTYAYIESQDFASESYVTNAINGIDMSSYITSDELDAMGYITADDIPELPDVSGFVTNQQLSNMSYVTSSALSNMGYITAQDVPSADMSAYVTHTELNNAGYITINDVPTPDLSSYVTHTELNNASYATESYVATNYAAKTDVPVNGIKFVNDSPIAVSYLWAGTNAELAQVSPRDNNTLYITTDDATTYVDLTPYALKSETAKVVTLTSDQYNALIATGPVDEYTIYLIIEQQ